MFNEECSTYKNAMDRYGSVTTINDFLFTNKWKSNVEHLRELIKSYGSEKAAKATEEYKNTKKMLPCATLSGKFKYRKGSELLQHTGYICLDIDRGDNTNISDWQNVKFALTHRPEVALLMKSCSGLGYFALVKLAHPDQHLEQYISLEREYASLGISLDKACKDVTRLRFATWDDDYYINEKVLPYTGACADIALKPKLNLAPRMNTDYSGDKTLNLVEGLVKIIEQNHVDITDNYQEWVRIGYSLATLGEVGRSYFHRVSCMSSKYNAVKCDKQFNATHPAHSGIGAFFNICRDYGIVMFQR